MYPFWKLWFVSFLLWHQNNVTSYSLFSKEKSIKNVWFGPGYASDYARKLSETTLTFKVIVLLLLNSSCLVMYF